MKPNAPPETSRTGGGLGCATTKPSLLGRPTSAREAARQLGRSGNRRQRAHPHQALCKFSRAWLAVGAGILPLQDSTGSPEMLGDQEWCIRELRDLPAIGLFCNNVSSCSCCWQSSVRKRGGHALKGGGLPRHPPPVLASALNCSLPQACHVPGTLLNTTGKSSHSIPMLVKGPGAIDPAGPSICSQSPTLQSWDLAVSTSGNNCELE